METVPLETPYAAQDTAPPTALSGFAPLRIPLFRDRWIASTVSSVGTWMQDTAGTWLMTSLTASPLLIALMQTAASLPVLALGLLAGATADLFDRRRLLIFWQSWMLGSVAVLAVLTFLGHISPGSLLAFTFLLNIGSAMNNPAWQAIVPELVPRKLIPDSVSLNAASNNIARAVGPALGGLMVAAFKRTDTGTAYVFLLNSVSFAGVIWVLVNWKRIPLFKSALPSERMAASIASGLRYVRYAPNMQASLLRAFTFTFFFSAVWALLAVVAHNDLHQGALGYGILNGSLGLGAVTAAFTLAHVRRRFSTDRIIAAATFYCVFTLIVLARIHRPSIIIATLIGGGFCWTCTMASLNTSVQVSVPAWVQARALGAYMMTFQGGLALGSVLWGALAQRWGAPIALLCAAGGLAGTFPFVRHFRILQGGIPDTTPHQYKRAAPELAPFPEDDPESSDPAQAGPVRISIVYRIPTESYAEFTRLVHQLRRVRMRGGALRWGIYRDTDNPEHLNETFIMESWLDFLRSRERVTAADDRIRKQVWRLHRDSEPPKTSYQVYAREVANPTPPPTTDISP
jgi:MFS family permease